MLRILSDFVRNKTHSRIRELVLILCVLVLGLLTLSSAGCEPDEANLIVSPTPDVGTSEQSIKQALTDPSLGASRIRPIDGMEMVYVPAGEFNMGSEDQEVDDALQLCLEYGTNCSLGYFAIEKPVHIVKLSGFWLDKTEVTNNHYQRCVEAEICEDASCQEIGLAEHEDLPVVCVTWQQATTYCEWAGARLPTEAEWEYAARGLDGRQYPWGSEFDGRLLNYCDENCELGKSDEAFDDGYARSAPVGSYPEGASWVGALDMAGNVWEWTADWYGAYPTEQQLDPAGPSSGNRRLARGGSWHASPDHVHGALRTYSEPGRFYDHMGFRCAISAP